LKFSSKKKVPRHLLILLIVFLVAMSFSCSKKKEIKIKKIKKPHVSPTPSPPPGKKDSGESIFFKASKLLAREGKLKNWHLSADKITYDKANDRAEAETVQVQFYNPKNEVTLTVTARGAEVNMKDKSLRFHGEVEAEAASGEKLIVRKLRWDNKKKLLIGEEYVKITRKNSIMTGRRMEADPELKRVVLSGGVKVNYPDARKFLKF